MIASTVDFNFKKVRTDSNKYTRASILNIIYGIICTGTCMLHAHVCNMCATCTCVCACMCSVLIF